ncbi:MAG: ribosome small subunit-dependent GTPase A [Paludibacteraceae bacterium]|nr:ribosome small subunit-dependent GTPase A [Paludibacteraceae bacterium]
MQGQVIRNTGSYYQVKATDGATYDCKIKGAFRIKGIKSTNPVAVGDNVSFALTKEGIGLINNIEERRNYIVRKPSNLSKQLHIIAANLDQALLIVTINHPVTSTTFIDRFLATCEAYRVPAIIAINKIDCYDDDEKEYMAALCNLYESIGYKCLTLSAVTKEGIEELKEVLRGKTTLFSGNSGVGKSSIINSISEKFQAKTGAISESHNTGMHTTTFSEMFEWEDNSNLIDTPGIKGFGTIDFQKEEVGHFFPEIFKASAECKFNNCTHTHEPGCAVLEAVENHLISQSRYTSYISIIGDADESKYR